MKQLIQFAFVIVATCLLVGCEPNRHGYRVDFFPQNKECWAEYANVVRYSVVRRGKSRPLDEVMLWETPEENRSARLAGSYMIRVHDGDSSTVYGPILFIRDQGLRFTKADIESAPWVWRPAP